MKLTHSLSFSLPPSLADCEKGPAALRADVELCGGEGVGGLAAEDLPNERRLEELLPPLRVHEQRLELVSSGSRGDEMFAASVF